MMGTHLPQDRSKGQLWRSVALYTACYLLWLAFSALGFWLILQLHVNLVDLAFWLRANPWVLRAIDHFALFLLGLLWLGGVMGLEGYLRNGVATNRFWVRSTRVGVILIILSVISYVLQRLPTP
jgi:hypothetical protein